MPKKKTREEFVRDARKVHGDRYNYDLVEYINNHTKIKIKCPVHGIFEQVPYSHTQGKGCLKCVNDKQTLTVEDFITKSKVVHGDRYDYSFVEYVNCYTKVKINCNIHGIFEQMPHSHLKGNHGLFTGNGCPKCFCNALSSTEVFISKSKVVHGDRYDYSKVVYIGNSKKVIITCPVHGDFYQTPNHHLRGQGCKSCFLSLGKSKQEISFINFIKSVYFNDIVINSRDIISPYELDIYLPDKQLAFEYNGTYWHKEGVMKPFGYHKMKERRCKDKGIKLIHIWENEWRYNTKHTKCVIESVIEI